MAINGFKAGGADPADPNLFINSMAEEIEKAFLAEWRAVKGWSLEELYEAGKLERHILFVAIARGVLKHLQDHAEEGFNMHGLTLKQKQDNGIVIKGQSSDYVTGSFVHHHELEDVPQKPYATGDENRVISNYLEGFQINIEDMT